MSTARHGVDRKPLVKGPGGRNLCRWCQTEVEPPRRTFCSQACVDEFLVRSSGAAARRLVEQRDRGVCAVCRVDTARIARVLALLHRRMREVRYEAEEGELGGAPYRGFRTVAAWTPGWALARVRRAGQWLAGWIGPVRAGHYARNWGSVPHLWEMDHIVPVAEGGGRCGLDNLRTLCIPCHVRVTKDLRTRLKEARRAAR